MCDKFHRKEKVSFYESERKMIKNTWMLLKRKRKHNSREYRRNYIKSMRVSSHIKVIMNKYGSLYGLLCG